MFLRFFSTFLPWGKSHSVKAEEDSSFPATVITKEDHRIPRHQLRQSVIYQVKKDALMVLAEMNRGQPYAGADNMAKQLAFIQKELIQAAYNDPTLSAENKELLVQFHLRSVKTSIGERRAAARRL